MKKILFWWISLLWSEARLKNGMREFVYLLAGLLFGSLDLGSGSRHDNRLRSGLLGWLDGGLGLWRNIYLKKWFHMKQSSRKWEKLISWQISSSQREARLKKLKRESIYLLPDLLVGSLSLTSDSRLDDRKEGWASDLESWKTKWKTVLLAIFFIARLIELNSNWNWTDFPSCWVYARLSKLNWNWNSIDSPSCWMKILFGLPLFFFSPKFQHQNNTCRIFKKFKTLKKEQHIHSMRAEPGMKHRCMAAVLSSWLADPARRWLMQDIWN